MKTESLFSGKTMPTVFTEIIVQAEKNNEQIGKYQKLSEFFKPNILEKKSLLFIYNQKD